MSTSAAWRAARRAGAAHPERVLAPVLLAGFGWVVLQILAQMLVSATITPSQPCTRYVGTVLDPTRCAAGDPRQVAALAVSALVFCFLGGLFWAVALVAAARVVGVEPARPGTLLGRTTATAAILAVVTTLGLIACVLPGIGFVVLSQFVMVAVVTEGRGPGSALREAIAFVVTHPATALGATALSTALLLLGATLLVVGLWPAVALAALVQVHVWTSRPSAAEPAADDGIDHPPLGTMAR